MFFFSKFGGFEALCKSLHLDEVDDVLAERFAFGGDEVTDQGFDLGVQGMNGVPFAEQPDQLSLECKYFLLKFGKRSIKL